jgi:hypothetical protein
MKFDKTNDTDIKKYNINETEIATSINILSLPQKTTTLITSTEITEITEIIENILNASDADIANINDANTTLENIENAPFKNIIIEPAPVRRSTRHWKATIKAIGANTMGINTVGAAETPPTPANKKESEEKNYLPKAIITKSTTANEDKSTYEKIMANLKKP